MTFHLHTMSKSIEAAHGASFLEELNTKWNDHTKALQMIRDILMYMDRTFIPSTHKTAVHELGLNLWRDNVIHSSKIQPRLLNTLLDLILRERTGEVINRGLMRNIFKMLMDLGPSVYQEDFEKPFLEVSAEFYRAESLEFIECSDCGDYLKKAERRLNEEIERVSHYLDAKTEVKITNVVEKEMIANHMPRLVHMENSGLVKMLLDDKFEDLGRIYNLFRRVPDGLSTIRDVMTSHIRDTGKQLVTDPEKSKNPAEFVDTLLEKRDKYDRIISLAFSNDKTFQNALNASFEYFINLNPRSPEYISLFVDDKLRKGLKGEKEEDIEIILDKVMMLFRYLQEKDVFEKYYKQHLAKRLLSGKTVSDDAEKSDNQTEDRMWLNCQLYVRSSDHITLVPILVGDYPGRLMGTADLRATFSKWSESLACVKGKNVLQKEPMSKDIGEDDAFSVNDKFTSKLRKVKIGTVVAQKETEPEKQETRQRVEEDRKPQIEAAIVRIMKSRRVLDHNNIIAEVTKQLQSRFLANPGEIKKRIESLIERDFLERDDSDRRLYRYLA
ncbi:Cullin-3A [Sesamum angolense]|uniref:Cullin-3A n=1 Tax=Sesamum angolense TaxID=2727404 RepID=A0AAE1X096_9LAMI|nr:Cullin-3A [Sesamum angolense]